MASIKYTLEMMRPSYSRKTTKDIFRTLDSYEKCEKNYENDYPYSLLHYAFMFRRFEIVNKMLCELEDSERKEALHFEGPNGYEWITPLVCAKWNLNYICAYDDKNGTNIYAILELYLDEVDYIEEIVEYTDEIDKDGKDIFALFWGNRQPMLDVVFYEKQKLPSKQVNKNQYSIVMDEVGTGKTVSSLYAIKDMIQKKNEKEEKAKILIVCPYNKREDWQNDIRRQMGRYAHIVEQSDNGMMYQNHLKKVFFKEHEHIIMISGQKQGNDNLEGPHSALKGTILSYSLEEKWDLVIIDEAHSSFPNYIGINAKNVMLLTATPIVVNANGKRTFADYVNLVSKILGRDEHKLIDPINTSVPSEDDIYVNWFREDMGKKSVERKIRFISCKRWKQRNDVYYQIRDNNTSLAALQYDQDDDYLYWAASKQYHIENIPPVRKNGKIDRLIALLCENIKSYIIFCEHQFVVDKIFQCLKDKFMECVVAEKYGKYENQCGLGNVQEGQLINTLMQALRLKKRVLFVTTGKTGGTGLNLGEFDGVIHYELPFTSIELEQRFGRIDRMDTRKETKAKDMIFMLNECKADENDMEVNRMLYYCTTKIDITCQYMPIRNTVLYYPEFIKRNGEAIRESLKYFQKEYVLSEENENKIRNLRREIQKYEKEIKENLCYKYIESLDKNLRLSALKALENVRDERIPEEYHDLLYNYLRYCKDTKPERLQYQKMYRMFLEAKKSANNWLAIVGLIKVEEDNDIFVGHKAVDDGEEQIVELAKEEILKKPKKSIKQQITETITLIETCILSNEKLKSFSSEGIFCYVNGRIKRSSVQKYRSGQGWN